MFSHFWNVNIVFSTGQLVEPYNDLMTVFIFLVCYLRSFLYKGMLFAFLHHWGTCLTFSFLLLLSRFFFLRAMRSFSWHLFFFVACFCFAAQFLWSLGFDIKLYTGVHNALMLSLALVFEATLAFVLAIKLLQHLPLQHGHISCLFHKVA